MKNKILLLVILIITIILLVAETVLSEESAKPLDPRLVNAPGEAWEGYNVDGYYIFYSNGRFIEMVGGSSGEPDTWQDETIDIDIGIWYTELNKLTLRSDIKRICTESYGIVKEPYGGSEVLLCLYRLGINNIYFRRKKDPMSLSDAAIRKKKAVAAAHRGHKYLKSADDNHVIAYYDSACVEFTRARLLNGGNTNAYYGRGRTYLRLGNNKQAIADFNEAIRLNPKDAISLSNRGRAYARIGDYEQAVADFEAAAEIDPKNELIKQNLERARRHEDGL
jgi:tetratricopeptide (TPR) repeat protein